MIPNRKFNSSPDRFGEDKKDEFARSLANIGSVNIGGTEALSPFLLEHQSEILNADYVISLLKTAAAAYFGKMSILDFHRCHRLQFLHVGSTTEFIQADAEPTLSAAFRADSSQHQPATTS